VGKVSLGRVKKEESTVVTQTGEGKVGITVALGLIEPKTKDKCRCIHI
jgi:hypothetical protein